jgi:hypothetical protein
VRDILRRSAAPASVYRDSVGAAGTIAAERPSSVSHMTETKNPTPMDDARQLIIEMIVSFRGRPVTPEGVLSLAQAYAAIKSPG